MTFQVERGGAEKSSWTKVADTPERWQRPGFGMIVARTPRLWAFLPICGHDFYPAFSREEAQGQAERRSGLCGVCWQQGVTGATRSLSSALPLAAQPPASATVATNERQPGVVLIVEDDLDTRETVGELLEEYGYSVFGAGNGAEGVHLLQSGTVPSVILLDLMMPVMDGYRFRAEQRSDPALAAIPVIVMTAGESIELDELNASAVMRKPLHVPRLLSSIRQHCSC